MRESAHRRCELRRVERPVTVAISTRDEPPDALALFLAQLVCAVRPPRAIQCAVDLGDLVDVERRIAIDVVHPEEYSREFLERPTSEGVECDNELAH